MPNNDPVERWWQIDIWVLATEEDRDALCEKIENLICTNDHESGEPCPGPITEWTLGTSSVDQEYLTGVRE